MFAKATIGIFVVNSDGAIVEANPFSEKLFGYNVGELLHQQVEILLPDAFRARHIQHRDSYVKNPVPRSMGANLDLYGLKKDGTNFPIVISLSHMDIEEKRFVIAYVSDDSSRQKILQELEESKIKLVKYSDDLEQKVIERTKELETSRSKLKTALEKEKELNELKSRFVSMASHEFRTPLSSILSSANLIAKYEAGDQQEKRKKHVNRISSSVKNLTAILNDFLSLEKLESGKVRTQSNYFGINEFVEQIIDEIQLIAKEDQKIIHHHEGDNNVNSDEYLLKNILINLLSNSIKYSPNGKNVELFTQSEKDKISIKVKDYGIGIPKADQQYMFTRLFRAHNVMNIKGTGLGLTIVKRYLDLMKGKIWFESSEGNGTTFFVEIPLNQK